MSTESEPEWLQQVRSAYEAEAEAEWRRLEYRVQNRIEYLITTHILERHLPPARPERHVLDAGGGPGRYTIDLARRGYSVTLLDLSPSSLDLAREKIADAGSEVAARVNAICEGDITNLSGLPDNRFDAVVCLGGTLSHIVEPAYRLRALAELKRVAKPGTPIIISAGNCLSSPRSFVQWPYLWDAHPEYLDTPGVPLENGAPYQEFLPEEFTAMLAEAGLELADLYGCQGLAAHLRVDHLEALMAHEERWRRWRKPLLETCNHPNIVGMSCHLIAVTRA